jgi:hypothetical protein
MKSRARPASFPVELPELLPGLAFFGLKLLHDLLDEERNDACGHAAEFGRATACFWPRPR